MTALYTAKWQAELERALAAAVSRAIRERSSDPIRRVGGLLLSAAEVHRSQRVSESERELAPALLVSLQSEVTAASMHTADATLAFDADDRATSVACLRSALLSLSAAQASADRALQELIDAGAPTSRAGYLRSLPELLPAPVSASAWRDEWPELFAENLRMTGQEVDESKDAAWAAKHESVQKWTEKLAGDIGAIIALGAPREEAEAYVLLTSKRFAMARRLRERDPKYAASTFALTDAIVAQSTRQAAAGVVAPALFYNLRGLNSLVRGDPSWDRITLPDNTGFRGVCSSALCAADCGTSAEAFSEKGFCVYHREPDGSISFPAQDSPVVKFESAPEDEHGLHTAVMVKEGVYGVFPPNTLFRLQRIEPPGWRAPNGAEVQQPLYVVSATYRPSRPLGANGTETGGKMCAAAMTLTYGGRAAFVEGLDGLLPLKPPLTMAQEFSRCSAWTDWKGARYTLEQEWDYVMGPSVPRPGCTAGHRDPGREGVTPAGYLKIATDYISGRRADAPLLSLDEVLAVRLYSGPAFQPINTFLRQLAALSGEHRTALARHPGLSFAATCRHLSAAVRKLAAVATDDELAMPLYRGVRGELRKNFWMPDEQGMVVATDTAFMSTSRARSTPLAYMGDGENVLWELQPRRESDAAFHCGADISMLSQFGCESEVLFPPCTMLVVSRRDGGHSHAPAARAETAQNRHVEDNGEQHGKDYEGEGAVAAGGEGRAGGDDAGVGASQANQPEHQTPAAGRAMAAVGGKSEAGVADESQAWRSRSWRAEHATEAGKRFVVVAAQPCFV